MIGMSREFFFAAASLAFAVVGYACTTNNITEVIESDAGKKDAGVDADLSSKLPDAGTATSDDASDIDADVPFCVAMGASPTSATTECFPDGDSGVGCDGGRDLLGYVYTCVEDGGAPSTGCTTFDVLTSKFDYPNSAQALTVVAIRTLCQKATCTRIADYDSTCVAGEVGSYAYACPNGVTPATTPPATQSQYSWVDGFTTGKIWCAPQ